MERRATRPQSNEPQQKVMTAQLTLRKARHLCLQRDIESIFAKGNSNTAAFPLRAVWKWIENEADASNLEIPYKVMFCVSKRHLRHAVDRNRAKRQMREAFRLNQKKQATAHTHTLHLAFIWLSDTPQPTQKVERAIQRVLERIELPQPNDSSTFSAS